MDKRGESVKFVVMVCTALLLLGVMFVNLGKSTSVESRATYADKTCYALINGQLSTQETSICCNEIKKSSGCKVYDASKGLYICEGDSNVVVNKETISYCG